MSPDGRGHEPVGVERVHGQDRLHVGEVRFVAGDVALLAEDEVYLLHAQVARAANSAALPSK